MEQTRKLPIGIQTFEEIAKGRYLYVDKTAMSPYAALCGITKEELLQTFRPELEYLAQRRGQSLQEVADLMERQYDGYHFHPQGAGMFNPFSVSK